MQVTGNIKVIGETQSFGSNGFTKRDLVVTTEEQYPQTICIEFVKDKTSLLDSLGIGEKVTVSINLRGREWINEQGDAKYFNSIQGWRVESAGSSASTPTQPFTPAKNLNEEDHDDLPF